MEIPSKMHWNKRIIAIISTKTHSSCDNIRDIGNTTIPLNQMQLEITIQYEVSYSGSGTLLSVLIEHF